MPDVSFFAETRLRELPVGRRIMTLYPDIFWIEDYRQFRRKNVREEKNCVIFAKKRGPWLKSFPYYYDDNFGYSFFGLDVAEGCLFDCVYCYLQSYLNHGALVLFVDVETVQRELNSLANAWVSAGLLTDSLLSEIYFPVLPHISKLIPKHSVLEIRTKAAAIQPLEDRAIERDNVVVSWSLNPPEIARTYEYGAAPVDSRIAAAAEAVRLGYRVGFHFDPVFYFPGWERAYDQLLQKLTDFDDRIAFLSLGLFRFMPELGEEIRKRFPFHPLFTGEFFVDTDGKYHYFRSIRKEMYAKFAEWLAPWKNRVPVFSSMEPDARLRI